MEVTKDIPKSTERLLYTRQTTNFFPAFGDFNRTTSISNDIKVPEIRSVWNRKSEDRNAVTDTRYSTVMSSYKKNSPENYLELPSIEKLSITENYDSWRSPTAEKSIIETPESYATVLGNNEKPKTSRRLYFKATPANSSDLKGFDKMFGHSIKPEEKYDITEETDRRELQRTFKSYETPAPSRNPQFQDSPYQEKNYEPQVWCRIDKNVVMRLIESHSIKDYPNQDEFINRFYRIEGAFYEYLEKHIFQSTRLDRCTLFTFAWHVHNLEPSLRIYLDNLSNYYLDWKKFKYSLPTYGAALLSEEASHIVMVQSSICKNSWGFPKGKVMGNEDPVSCAIREVREETGFDIQDLIRDDNYIEHHDSQGRTFGLYIIEGIPRNTKFMSMCKFEIKAIEWKPIEQLVTDGGKFLINIVSKHFIPKLKDKNIIP